MNKPLIKMFTGMVLLISTTIMVCNSANSEEPAGKEISVVLDPAFGGTETGAVGAWGLKEKDVTLDVAIRTKECLEKTNPAIKVYLTRTKDEAVSEKEREKFIQIHNPVLVVRLRLNSSNKFDASGFSVHYDKKSKESKRLAEIILTEIADIFVKDIVPNGGIQPSDIYKDIQIPAVEVFLGYITNPDIEANFKSPKVKEVLAESIGRAIVRYLGGGGNKMSNWNKQADCINNLKQVGLALNMYAQDHDGKFPENPTLLQQRNYISSLSILACPGRKTTFRVKTAESDILISYIYVNGLTVKDWNVKDKPNSIVMYDAFADNHGEEGRNVLFVDGHIAYYHEKDFQVLLQTFMNEYKNRVILIPVEVPVSVEKTLAEFRKTYVLSAGEDFKYINPPLREKEGPDNIFFHWSEGEGLRPEGQGYGMTDIRTVLRIFVEIYPQEVEGDQDLINTKIPGDFIVRIGTSPERIVERLEEVMRQDLKLPARLVFRNVERKVIVVQGAFHLTPLPERQPPNRIDIYGENLNQDPRTGGGGGGDFQTFLKWVGMYLNRRVISDVQVPSEGPLNWHYNDKRKGSDETGLVLQHLTEQTGLTFKEENRQVRVLFVERGD